MNFRMGNKGSWLSVKNYIPGRVQYLYWDKEPLIGEIVFALSDAKIRYRKIRFVNKENPFIGVFITGWAKDREEIENSLDWIDAILRRTNDKYEDFLNVWHQNLISFQEREK